MEPELSILVSPGIFDNFETKESLFYSERPSGFIIGKWRYISGAFAQNFISSPRFDEFFKKLSQPLSNLKHLRLCGLRLTEENITALAQTLNLFKLLEELAFFDFGYATDKNKRTNKKENPRRKLELHLPKLINIRLQQVDRIETLTLDAPNLKEVTACGYLRLDIRHGESIEKLLVANLKYIKVKKLKNLKYLYSECCRKIDSTFLEDLEHLQEIHLSDRSCVLKLLDQKQRYGRADLKIYLCGYLLNGPDDRAIRSLSHTEYLGVETFGCLAWANDSRLADKIPLYDVLDYTAIERVPPGLAIDVLNRLTHLDHILVLKRIEDKDIQRFLDLLKRFPHIVALEFFCDQPRGLFDRLPEHCAVQWLTIYKELSDFEFLFRLNHLVFLTVLFSIDSEFIRKVFEKLQFLSWFSFKYKNRTFTIEIVQVQFKYNKSKFQVLTGGKRSKDDLDLDAVIEFITEEIPIKQKSKVLEYPTVRKSTRTINP